MVRGLEVGPGESVIEFGPGTGPFTEAIRRCLADPGSYLGVERDASFVSLLRERFGDLHFVVGSAEHAARLHVAAGLGPVKAIICGLPFASLPARVQDAVIAALDELIQPGNMFRTFQYVHAYPLPAAMRFRRRMKAIFGPCQRRGPVLANLPPAFVLTWRRALPDATA
jgi:phospholipid N-methyltransferase